MQEKHSIPDKLRGKPFDVYEYGIHDHRSKKVRADFLDSLVAEGKLYYWGNKYPYDRGYRTYSSGPGSVHDKSFNWTLYLLIAILMGILTLIATI